LLIASALPAQSPDTGQARLTALLRAKDQALLDATAPGDRAAWDKLLAPDFVYVDENNHITPRAQYLKELLPLPKGASGSIAIRTYQLQRQGDTALVIHYDDETEHFFGSDLHAEYLMSETWQLTRGEWKLRLVHCAAVPTDPPAVTLTHAQIDELTGTYRAGALTQVIHRDGDRILATRAGRPDTELKAETRDVLFVPGQPRTIKVFQRNAAGKVTGFADRRENRDLFWTRVD
jgi:hypothetical protein